MSDFIDDDKRRFGLCRKVMGLNIQSFCLKQGVVKNKEVYWIHRILAIFYALVCGFMAIGLISTFEMMNSVFVLLVVLLPLGWISYLHWLASLESMQGTERGRRMTLFIALILLMAFPLGTLISICLLYKSSQNLWQFK